MESKLLYLLLTFTSERQFINTQHFTTKLATTNFMESKLLYLLVTFTLERQFINTLQQN